MAVKDVNKRDFFGFYSRFGFDMAANPNNPTEEVDHDKVWSTVQSWREEEHTAQYDNALNNTLSAQNQAAAAAAAAAGHQPSVRVNDDNDGYVMENTVGLSKMSLMQLKNQAIFMKMFSTDEDAVRQRLLTLMQRNSVDGVDSATDQITQTALAAFYKAQETARRDPSLVDSQFIAAPPMSAKNDQEGLSGTMKREFQKLLGNVAYWGTGDSRTTIDLASALSNAASFITDHKLNNNARFNVLRVAFRGEPLDMLISAQEARESFASFFESVQKMDSKAIDADRIRRELETLLSTPPTCIAKTLRKIQILNNKLCTGRSARARSDHRNKNVVEQISAYCRTFFPWSIAPIQMAVDAGKRTFVEEYNQLIRTGQDVSQMQSAYTPLTAYVNAAIEVIGGQEGSRGLPAPASSTSSSVRSLPVTTKSQIAALEASEYAQHGVETGLSGPINAQLDAIAADKAQHLAGGDWEQEKDTIVLPADMEPQQLDAMVHQMGAQGFVPQQQGKGQGLQQMILVRRPYSVPQWPNPAMAGRQGGQGTGQLALPPPSSTGNPQISALSSDTGTGCEKCGKKNHPTNACFLYFTCGIGGQCKTCPGKHTGRCMIGKSVTEAYKMRNMPVPAPVAAALAQGRPIQ